MKFKKYLALSLAAAMVVTGVPGVGVLTNPMNVMANSVTADAADATDVKFKLTDSEEEKEETVSVFFRNDNDKDIFATSDYTGKDVKPSSKYTVVKVGAPEGNGATLKLNTDYTVKYYTVEHDGQTYSVGKEVTSIVNAGNYYVAFIGKGKYSGTIYAKYTVEQIDLSNSQKVKAAVAKNAPVSFTGDEIAPKLDSLSINYNVKDAEGKESYMDFTLTASDYKVTYAGGVDKVKPGPKELAITGTEGNFKGILNPGTVTCNGVSGSDVKITLNVLKQLKPGDATVYVDKDDDGTKIIQLKVVSGQYALKQDTGTEAPNGDFKVTKVTVDGEEKKPSDVINEEAFDKEYVVTIEGIKDKGYTGEITAKVKASTKAEDISDYKAVIVSDAIYTGDAVEPTIIVKNDSDHKILTAGKDYIVRYDNNINLGTAKYTVIGIGEYRGTITDKFSIIQNSIVTGTVGAIAPAIYTGQVQKLKAKDLVLTDFHGKAIHESDINGEGIKYYKIEDDDDGDLVADPSDEGMMGYKVVGEKDPIAAGTYVVEIPLKGNYAGAKPFLATYTIKPASIASGFKFTTGINQKADDFKVKYSGKIIKELTKPALIQLDELGDPTSHVLEEGVDYKIVTPKDAREVGEYSATVKATGNYVGEIPFTFNVVNSVSDIDIAYNVTENKNGTKVTYTVNPYTIVKEDVKGSVLTEGTEYKESFYACKAVDKEKADFKEGETFYAIVSGKTTDFTTGVKYVAVAEGIGTYEGTLYKTFELEDVSNMTSIADATVGFTDNYLSVQTLKREYTGAPIEIGQESSDALVVRVGNKLLTKGHDYILSYKDNVEVSKTAQVVVIGIGEYYGTVSAPFEITKKSIASGVTVSTDVDKKEAIGSYCYTGEGVNATVTVKDGVLGDLTEGEDYTVSYAKIVPDGNNAKVDSTGAYLKGDNIAADKVTDVGSYVVVITGKGNYTGETTQLVKISKVDLSAGGTVSIKGEDILYSGSEVTPSFTMVDKKTLKEFKLSSSNYTVKYYADKACKEPVDSVTEVGTYYAKLKGQTNAIGTSDAIEFNVVAATSIEDADITVMGDTKDAKVVVTLGDKLLKSGVDYDADIVIDDGIGTVTVTGKGIYTGTATTTFKLPAVALSKAKVSLSSSSYTYDGKTKKPSVTVKIDGKKVASSQYTVKYSSNKNAGTAKVTITAKDSSNVVKGSTSVKFTIKKANQKLTVSPSSKSFKVKNIKAKKATFTVKVKGAKGTVSYKSSSKNVTVTKKGAVTIKKGTKKGTYKITVTSAKTTNYNAAKKTVTIKVK